MIAHTHLEVEVEKVNIRDTLVDDGAGESIAVLRRVLRVGRPEPRIVSLAADDNAQLGLVSPRGGYLLERSLKPRELVRDDLFVLRLP